MSELIRVAIDGPAGAGKTTISKLLAARLGIDRIDTGAMYRAVALKLARTGVDHNDPEALAAMLESTDIDFSGGHVLLDGEDVEGLIRTPEISELASVSSAVLAIREKLVAMQREIGLRKSVVMDGRDITTNVLPFAEFKFYLTASVEERARRRALEYFEKEEKARLEAGSPALTEEEKTADPWKKDTGLFFFRGEPGAKVAICNAGGGFAYVGAMHDSFPHALELSEMGYNAFALIYRPGAQTACEDLARAIAFIHEHADELQVDVSGYSLWGGSAGARMAAWLGSYGTEAFGEKTYPRPGTVIMQYTGLSEVTGNEPATYNCVGTNDGIASYRTMERRIAAIQANGMDAMIEVFPGLSHGFGLGTGTLAEGWIKNAVAFWEKQMISN